MRKRLYGLIACGIFSQFTSTHLLADNIYRWIDTDGVLHLSDTPPVKTQNLEVHVDLLSIPVNPSLPAPPTPAVPPVPSASTLEEKTITAKKITLISPQHEETFRNNNGNISIQYKTDQPLGENQEVVVTMDNKKVGTYKKSPIQLKNIFRGSHRLKLTLTENKKTINTSAGITFYLHRGSVINKSAQAVMAVQAPLGD